LPEIQDNESFSGSQFRPTGPKTGHKRRNPSRLGQHLAADAAEFENFDQRFLDQVVRA
jgi:hypothetical protein